MFNATIVEDFNCEIPHITYDNQYLTVERGCSETFLPVVTCVTILVKLEHSQQKIHNKQTLRTSHSTQR